MFRLDHDDMEEQYFAESLLFNCVYLYPYCVSFKDQRLHFVGISKMSKFVNLDNREADK